MRTQLWQLACLYWTTANLLAFALMGLDKRRARRGLSLIHISEPTRP